MNWRLAATAAFTTLVTGAALYTARMLEGAPQPLAEGRRAGRVAVIVPARNEERNAERSVGSLLVAAAAYGAAVVVVVDDGSTDRTPEVLHTLQRTHPNGHLLHVLRLDERLPEGWKGKNRACWTASQHEAARTAEWLLFVDADTESSPALIGRLVAGAEESGADLFTIFPHQELCTPAERLIMPHLFYVLAVGFPWRAVNDPDNPRAIANGQCILIRRSVYDAVGGHAAIRDAIAEDKKMAERVKGAGYRLRVVDGRDLMRTRMYTSLPEIWEGWTKNAYLGLGDRAWLLLVAVFFGLSGGVVPFVGLFTTLRRREWQQAGLWAVTLAVILQNRDRAMREFEVPRWYAVTVPIGAVLCSGIAFSAWFKVVSGAGVKWKGRRYNN